MLANLAPATATRTGLGGYPTSQRRLTRTALGLNGLPRTTRVQVPQTAGLSPSVSAVSATAYLGSMTITGTNFGASQTGVAAVTIGGVTQTVTSWSATSLVISSLARGGLAYGVPVSLQVTNSSGGTTSYTLAGGIQPQAGWSYVNVTSINPYTPGDLQASPAIAIGDQVAWGNVLPSGTVTVNADTTFSASTRSVQTFQFEVNSSGAWSPSLATVTLTTTLMGAVSVTSLATGALSTAIQLAGAMTDLSTATGAITTGISLAGSATDVSTANAALTTKIQLLAAAVDASTGSGTLGGGVQMAGNAVSTSTVTANLSTTISLIGTMVDVSTAAGNLATQILLAAAALDASAGSGALTVLGQQLAGSATDGSTAAGALTTGIPLSGAAISAVAALGSLTAQIQLAGTAVSNSSGSAALSIPGGQALAGAAASVSSAAGALTTLIQMSGVAYVRTTVTGVLGGAITLTAAATDASTATGALNAPGSPVGVYPVDQLYLLAYQMHRYVNWFPPIAPTDNVVLTWDFTNRLATGEYLNGRITVAVTLNAGADPNPSDMLVQPAAYDLTQTKIEQPVANGLVGNNYLFTVSAPTSNAEKALTMFGLLPVRL